MVHGVMAEVHIRQLTVTHSCRQPAPRAALLETDAVEVLLLVMETGSYFSCIYMGINCSLVGLLLVSILIFSFSPNRPIGPILSRSCNVRPSVCVSVPFPCNFFCVCGLVLRVTCPWTGVDRPSPSRGVLKTGMCPQMGVIPPFLTVIDRF